jgi:SAM-dependent methyltransferase
MPPVELILRVGTASGSRDPSEAYLADGRRVRGIIEEMLPEDWSFRGKRVLDFGCGAGRTLRQFLPDAGTGEFWGCDIDAPSIEWLRSNLCPPLHCFRNELRPPLPVDDGHFDLVLAMSVFTHIGSGWSEWLAEMHRILAPEGLFVASYLGPAVLERSTGEAYGEDGVGMHIRLVPLDRIEARVRPAVVFHSEWWLREHWGRAFDILKVRSPGDGPAPATQSHLVAQRRVDALSPDELERIDPGERRELVALQTNERLLLRQLDRALERRQARGALARRARRMLLRSPLGGRARELRRRLRRR